MLHRYPFTYFTTVFHVVKALIDLELIVASFGDRALKTVIKIDRSFLHDSRVCLILPEANNNEKS